MASPETPKMTPELLRSLSEATYENATQLLEEATLLLQHSHNARAYFLAVACAEEVGKSLIAHDAQNRNLADTAVCRRLKSSMESHSIKIGYMLTAWSMDGQDQSAAFQAALDLIGQLQRGREPSMYTDIRSDPDRVQTPTQIVRDVAAKDCVQFAKDALTYARHHLQTKKPKTITANEDRFFTMKKGHSEQIMNSKDFWWFYVSRLNQGHRDFADAVVIYKRDYFDRDETFSKIEQG